MIFSKDPITVAYTVEKCDNCGLIKKRKFSEGDVLFSNTTKCSSCEGMLVIEKIFGETMEQ